MSVIPPWISIYTKVTQRYQWMLSVQNDGPVNRGPVVLVVLLHDHEECIAVRGLRTDIRGKM